MVERLHGFGAHKTEYHGGECGIRTNLLTTWLHGNTENQQRHRLVTKVTHGPLGDV